MKTTNLIAAAFIGSTCTLSVLGYGMSAKAADLTPVDIELAFLIDGSTSISQSDFNTQVNTLSKIFSATNFYDVFVKPLPTHTLAVSAYQFGTQGSLKSPVISQLANWVLIDETHQQIGAAFSQDLSDGINNTKVGNFTPLGDAVSVITDALLNNQYDGHKVVNLSTDGFNTAENINSSTAAINAFFQGVTINAIVIPASQSDTGDSLPNPPYNLSKIQSIVNPYPNFPSEYQNKNFDGSSAFIMMDYATGQKTLQQALLLKLGKETIGETLFSSSPELIFPGSGGGLPDAGGGLPGSGGGLPGSGGGLPTSGGGLPTSGGGLPGSGGGLPTSGGGLPGSGGGLPTSGGGLPTSGGSTSASSDQTIPEPSAIFGLLSLGTLGLIKKIKG